MNLSFTPEGSKVKITHVMQAMEEAVPKVTPRIPTPDEIKLAITELKPIPQVALKLTRMLRGEEYDLEEIINELHSDQVMSAKLLQYCNSAWFGLEVRIDSIDRAVVTLGGKYILEAIISTAVDSFCQQGGMGGYTLMKGGMFKHSTAVANLAKVIAQLTDCEADDTAYTAGLLHDIGKVVLDRFVCNARPLFYAAEQDKVDDFIKLEQINFKCDHQAIGKKLAGMWVLPANLTAAISCHHYPHRAREFRSLAAIIHIADVLASLVVAGVEIEKIRSDYFLDSLDFVGLTTAMIPEIIDHVPWEKLMYR